MVPGASLVLLSARAKYPIPLVEVITPILEKTGRGEQELSRQLYDTYAYLAVEIKEILGLKDMNFVGQNNLGIPGLSIYPKVRV